MNDIAIIFACVPLYLINSVCDKYVSQKGVGANVYNAIKFFIGSICMLFVVLSEERLEFGLGSVVCGVACGVMYALSKTVILKGYEKSSVAFMTFCHSAGLIIPCILGAVLWNEHLSSLSLLGMLLTVLSAVLLKGGGKDGRGIGAVGLVIGLTVFLTSGGVMVCQKVMGIYFAEQGVSLYNLFSFIVPCIILSAVCLKTKTRCGSCKSALPFAIGSAVSLCVISFVMTSIAGRVPSVIMFPIFNGTGIVLVCIFSSIVFGEKLSGKRIVGLLLGILGMTLVNL